jgi:hypothetical protein
MRKLLILMVLSASSCLAQEVPPGPQQPATEPPEQASAAQMNDTVTVPEGTRVQLALANLLRTGAAHAGDTVRAVTTFPVTVDKDLAIPQGSYVEGSIVNVGKRGSTRFDGLQIEFRQVVFANGYNVALDGSVVEAKSMEPGTIPSASAVTAAPIVNSLQQQPTPPPLPQVGPSKGLVIGVGVAAMVGVMATVALLGHRHAHDQGRDFDTGFQFEIVLQAPLTLERARVAAALSGSGGR